MSQRVPGFATLTMALLVPLLVNSPVVRGQAHPTAKVPKTAGTWEVSGHDGAVVAGGAGAVDAGLEVLKAGGNAADAAAATILALTVTDATSGCFGGEVPILYYDAKTGTVEVIAGQGAAPALATPEFFQARGGIPAKGLEPAAVPALLDACITLLDRHGTITFAKAASPVLRLLDAGKELWHADLARTVRRLAEAESASGGDRRRGLRLVADYFYRGPIARELDAWCREHGGLIRYGDLARHVTHVEEPVTATYRGHTVVKCGLWTQGPALLEALQLLEGFDLKAMGRDSPDAVHHAVEALKLAMADRDAYYADPLYEDVPLAELLMPPYAEVRRTLIRPTQASLTLQPGDPRSGRPLRDEAAPHAGIGGPAHDTTTCLTADREGNIVAATPSGWSGVVAGSTGIWLGTRLQSFTLTPGHPNRLAPGKRPRITLTPTLVLKAGKPVLAVSVAGGDNQDQMTLQLLLDHIDFGLTPAESVTAPRYMSDHLIGSFLQTPPVLGGLRINSTYGPAVLDALKARGHKLTVNDTILAAAPTVIAIDPSTRVYRAAGDPRARRHAGAY